LACRSKDYFFVVPDNGILTPLLGELEEVVVLDRKEYFLQPVSRTFHARDIFAPCSAYLSKGIELKELGTPISRSELTTFPLGKPHFENDKAEGEILHIDRFGNIITNFKLPELLSWKGCDEIKVFLGKEKIENWVDFYAQGGDEPFLIEGSSGYLEISLRNKNAAQFFKAKVGERVVVVKNSPPL
ncbi:MAG: SAM-dependent chlorinase/fluorinase, partial [Caldiserica bacterium]|nr:SAM-dependent chlorinase/fluorinase [Caldisericota bacterium]